MPTVAEIDAQIRQLEDQKRKVITQERDALLAKANDAIAKLAELGFTYRLVSDAAPPARTPSASGRRTGIREQVLAAVKEVQGGITRSKLLETMGLKGDKSGEQSVSNALAALKKAKTITADDDGKYKVA